MISTCGHSTHPFESFLALLRAHSISQLADIRRYPASRRHPHFDRTALSLALEDEGIAYRHFDALGGMRTPRPDSPHVALSEDAFRGYADHMECAEFLGALLELQEWATLAPTAAMCAEANPAGCHRQLLSDALTLRGTAVLHLLDAETRAPHVVPPFLRRVGTRAVYDGGVLRLDLG